MKKIAKDTVRVGEPLKYRGGDYGWISKWMHPECYRVEGVTRDERRGGDTRTDALREGDREVLLATLTSPEKPAIEATALDVTSEEFCVDR